MMEKWDSMVWILKMGNKWELYTFAYFTSERGYARLDQPREIDTEKYRFTHLSRKNEFFTMNFGTGRVTFNLKDFQYFSTRSIQSIYIKFSLLNNTERLTLIFSINLSCERRQISIFFN